MTICERPSWARGKELALIEQRRISTRVDLLGCEGLTKKKEKIENAIADNSKQIPEGLLPVSSPTSYESIQWTPVRTVQAGKKLLPFSGASVEDDELQKHLNADGAELPFFMQFDHVQVVSYELPCRILLIQFKSDFVMVTALLSLATLPDNLRPCVKSSH